jgi:hypothetical protein
MLFKDLQEPCISYIYNVISKSTFVTFFLGYPVEPVMSKLTLDTRFNILIKET